MEYINDPINTTPTAILVLGIHTAVFCRGPEGIEGLAPSDMHLR